MVCLREQLPTTLLAFNLPLKPWSGARDRNTVLNRKNSKVTYKLLNSQFNNVDARRVIWHMTGKEDVPKVKVSIHPTDSTTVFRWKIWDFLTRCCLFPPPKIVKQPQKLTVSLENNAFLFLWNFPLVTFADMTRYKFNVRIIENPNKFSLLKR